MEIRIARKVRINRGPRQYNHLLPPNYDWAVRLSSSRSDPAHRLEFLFAASSSPAPRGVHEWTGLAQR